MARTAKITNANVAPSKNAAGLVGNTPVRAQDFNDLVGDYISSSDASAQTIASALTVSGASTLTGAVTATAGVQSSAVSVTATDAGAAIPAGTAVALIDADSDADHIVILPAPVVGNVIILIEDGTTGYELRSSAPATIGINGGTGSNVESAVGGAITYTRCVCVSATSWIANTFAADGTEAKLEAAA